MTDNESVFGFIRDKDWDGLLERVSNGDWPPNRPVFLAPVSSPDASILLLSVAAEHKQVLLAKTLIRLGADVNAGEQTGETALMTACDMGHRDVVDLLLQAGANVNTKTSRADDGDRGETPLMSAAANGHMEIVRRLLDAGASVASKTRKGLSALSYAVNHTVINEELVRLLLESGCSVDGRDLHSPVHQRNLEIVKLLLASKPDVNRPCDWPTWALSNKKGDTPLFVAVDRNPAEMLDPDGGSVKSTNRLAIIDLLIEAGADVNEQRGMKKNGWTPLMVAVGCDEDEVAKRLLAAGADPQKEVECSRITLVDGRQKQIRGLLSPVGIAQERPGNRKIRRLLLGHE